MTIKLIESSNEDDHFQIAYHINDTLVAAIKTDSYPNNKIGEKLIGHLQLQNIGIDACIRDLTFTQGKPTKFGIVCDNGMWSPKLNKIYLDCPVPWSTDLLKSPRDYEIIMNDFGTNFANIFNDPVWKSNLDYHLSYFFSSLKPYLK